ncbi:MAG: sodium:proton antiporter [Gammaproteobacteria bacterium]|nr:sodium:proton antiporter [Gammaproteobacteria bacterium]
MELLHIIATLVTVTAVFSYINHRFIRLPTTIGVMVVALVFSVVLLVLGWAGLDSVSTAAANLIVSVDFNTTLLNGMLSFLLFAGALHINLDDLAQQKWVVLSLATVGVITSTLLIGFISWFGLKFFDIEAPLVYCLLFGALISPTDPIAVLSTLKTAGVPKTLEIKIAGESLFNDGVGVVIFLVLFGVVTNPAEATLSHGLILFVQEAVGGALFGLAIGALAYWMLKSVDNYQVEVLITLALVTGGYALAMSLHLSGPIAMVIAGLFIGNHGRLFAMSDTTREHLDTFWELVDEILNAVLFVLIGLEVLALDIKIEYLLAGVVAIVLVLLVRFVSVGIPITILKFKREFSPNVVRILVWGGLRGGISVALALSLPDGAQRDFIVAVTYVIVVFSIVVQGLTIGKLVRRSQIQHVG